MQTETELAQDEGLTMDALLKCEVSAGQFEHEASVRAKDHRGETFSLFVPRQFVQAETLDNEWRDGYIKVEILQSEGNQHLVYLPGQTFSNGQAVTVRSDQIKSAQGRVVGQS